MSTPSGVPQAPVSAGGVEGQAAVIGEVAKEMYSLRFDGGSYLSRQAVSSPSNPNIFTYSVWVKFSNLSSLNTLIWVSSTTTTNGDADAFDFYGASQYLRLFVNGGNGGVLNSTSQYRDTSSWYNFLINGTNSTNNFSVYVNGIFLQNYTPTTYGTTDFNRANKYQQIGSQQASANFKGYLANIHFIDGEALDPSAFGELVSDVWRPASYSGDYGVNGFHLDFDPDNMIYDSNGKLTQVKDASGNDNHWTAN